MINDDGARKSLLEMSGITVSEDAVMDMALVESLQNIITSGDAMQEAKAMHGLVYLQLFHTSALVRHEAAFVIGESGRINTFLSLSALHDSDPVVRHEACLAMGAPGNSRVRKYRWTLEWISKNDPDEMVRDSALYALGKINKLAE